MDITVSSTTKLVTFNGVPARVWEGVSEKGVPVFAFITRVAVPVDAGPDALAQFEAELEHHHPPSVDVRDWPDHMSIPEQLGVVELPEASDEHGRSAV